MTCLSAEDKSSPSLFLGQVHVLNGEDDVAIKLMKEALEIYKNIGHNFGIGLASYRLSVIYQKRGDWADVIECLERCLEIPGHRGYRFYISLLACAYLQKGDAEKAIEYSKEVLEVGMSNSLSVARALGVMEAALAVMGKRKEFIPYCRKLRENKEEVQNLKLTQLYLEPKELSGLFTQTAFVDEFDESALKSEWEWVNPKGDSSYSLSSELSWLEVRAASEHDFLYQWSFDAPRLIQEISGDFAAEVKLKTDSDDLPSVGGLLVWKDEENYIRFERGMHGKDEIGLSGNVQSERAHLGRGMLASDTLYLRLERIGDKFSAYCSSDGVSWLTCGEVSFPAEEPIQVGVHAIGSVDSRGGTMDTATRFELL